MKKRVEEYKMDNSHCSCMNWGIIFAFTMDLEKHIKRGCPESYQPPVKRLRVENTDELYELGWPILTNPNP